MTDSERAGSDVTRVSGVAGVVTRTEPGLRAVGVAFSIALSGVAAFFVALLLDGCTNEQLEAWATSCERGWRAGMSNVLTLLAGVLIFGLAPVAWVALTIQQRRRLPTDQPDKQEV